ncbi:hypothetical protein U1872_00085 [Sphingomonas sp. RB3P16]|uniref:hypothetical protein n=1 Tax=Parasphingomonas frigoris TaxID=3096163 RepID=UPI002FCADFC1
MFSRLLVGAVALTAAVPAFAAPVEITARVLLEQRQAAADGTTRTVLMPAAKIIPGDRIVYRIEYRNTGSVAASGVVVANPIPAQLQYAGPAEGSPAPEVSTDGSAFGALGQLRVRSADGTLRPAALTDVRVVRWRLGAPVAGGSSGKLAFRAILK